MRSDLVVISWWSNCLGVACLHNLVNYTRNQNIYFIAVDKPEEHMERFRAHLRLRNCPIQRSAAPI